MTSQAHLVIPTRRQTTMFWKIDELASGDTWNKASPAQLSITKFKMFHQGEIMKKQYLTVLFTLICVLGLGLGARAQEQDTVVTNVPFDFVAGGKVLPAGNYRVMRVRASSGSRELEISSFGTGASVFVIPTVFDDVQSDKAQLNFEHLGGTYFLSAVETPIGTYAIDIPPAAIKLAQTQQPGGSHSGGH